MTSWASSDAVRKSMLGNRSRDTLPELRLRRELHRRGLRYRVNARPVPGLRRTADVLFTRARVAVMVDGCYWHGCPEHRRPPATNQGYWAGKVEGNVARDRDTDARLTAAGWSVLRLWEHVPASEAADAVEALVRAARERGAAA